MLFQGAGYLSKGRDGYRFQYVPEYLEGSSARCPAISLSFPKRKDPSSENTEEGA